MPLRRPASLPRLALSKNSDLNPPRCVPRINAGSSHVSRLLWLIVALRALSVKSALRLWQIFRQGAQLAANKGFLSSESAARRSTTVRCGAMQHPFVRRRALVAAAACLLTRSVCTSAVDCQQLRLTVDTRPCEVVT